MTEEAPSKSSRRWKDHLLRTGVPLENDVARILVNEGMSVNADYAYMRRDAAGRKELSTDLSADYMHVDRQKQFAFNLSLLVECKFRSREKSIVFFEDPNKVDFSPVIGGYTLVPVDAYAPFSLDTGPLVIENEFRVAYKAIELHDGGAVEEDFRHGIQQLRYAVPAYLRQTIDFEMSLRFDEVPSLVLAKILVTNATLYVMKGRVGIREIEKSTHLSEIATPVDSVVFFSDSGPDFEDHFRAVFGDGRDERLKFAADVRDRLQHLGKQFGYASDPVRLIEGMSEGSRYDCKRYGSQFLVTNLEALPRLVRRLKSACMDAYRSRTRIRLTKARRPRT